ncbi:MAG: o-succinylbenzoate synthase [Flavobacteriaceae bacterium]|nr:o-succinylbenzoate synthase [Flavobacteriaceae bacterium]
MEKYTLKFKRPGGTSRGVLYQKDTYLLKLEKDSKQGIGECNLFKGLSADDVEDYEQILNDFCQQINLGNSINLDDWRRFPSIQFGFEQAWLSLHSESNVLFPSAFTQGKEGLRINGLIWMGDSAFMRLQIREKLEQGFTCLKLKIGQNWQEEKQILTAIRNDFSASILELRVDANGAFSHMEVFQVLNELNTLQIHSIEQPIRAGNWEKMAELCASTPVPIALDEELIGVFDEKVKNELMHIIRPQYIILKPALVGGFRGSLEWIDLAKKYDAGWWITSALESNIGLNALAQWTFNLQNPMPQGLGTGGLFTNNFPSPLEIRGEKLWFNSAL